MKIHQNKNISKILLITGAIIILVGLGSYILYATTGSIFGWQPFSNQADNTENDQKSAGQQIKEDSLNNKGASSTDNPVDPVDDGNGGQTVGVDITSVQTIDSFTKVSTLISYLTQSGECSLVIRDSQGNETYRATAGVQALSNVATCKGFDIPNQNIPAGSYTITVKYTDGSTHGEAVYEA